MGEITEAEEYYRYEYHDSLRQPGTDTNGVRYHLSNAVRDMIDDVSAATLCSIMYHCRPRMQELNRLAASYIRELENLYRKDDDDDLSVVLRLKVTRENAMGQKQFIYDRVMASKDVTDRQLKAAGVHESMLASVRNASQRGKSVESDNAAPYGFGAWGRVRMTFRNFNLVPPVAHGFAMRMGSVRIVREDD